MGSSANRRIRQRKLRVDGPRRNFKAGVSASVYDQRKRRRSPVVVPGPTIGVLPSSGSVHESALPAGTGGGTLTFAGTIRIDYRDPNGPRLNDPLTIQGDGAAISIPIDGSATPDVTHGHTTLSLGTFTKDPVEPIYTASYTVTLDRAADHSPPPPVSPEAQAVLNRLSAPTLAEQNAIVAMVDGCVADGVWDLIYDFWAFNLTNGTDALTGWKVNASTFLTGGGTSAHDPGVGWDMDNTGYFLMGTTWDNMPAAIDFAGFYLKGDSSYGAPLDINTDYAGAVGGTGNENYLRSRTVSNSNDINATFDHTATTARPPFTGSQLIDDVCGWGNYVASNVSVLVPGGTVQAVARTDGVRTNQALSIGGRNNNGTPENGNHFKWRCFFMMQNTTGDADVLAVRSRITTYLTSLGSN